MFFIQKPEGLLIFVRVSAGAKQTQIKEYVKESSTKGFLKIMLQTLPEKGEANKALIKLLAQEWHIPQKNIKIIQGTTSKSKTLLIHKETRLMDTYLLQWYEKKFLPFL